MASLEDLSSAELLDRFERRVRFSHYDPLCREDVAMPASEGTLEQLRAELVNRLAHADAVMANASGA